MAERINLDEFDGVVRVRAWCAGHDAGSDYRRLEYGHLRDGRWWARDSRDLKGAVLVADERAACGWVERRMGVLAWRPTPARFDGTGQPCDGLAWRRAGGTWVSDAGTPSG